MQVRKNTDIINEVIAENRDVIAQADDWLKADTFSQDHLPLLLHYASRRGYMNILEILVDKKLIDINTKLFGQTTALMEAVDTNQTHAAEFLLKAGATQAPNTQGQYPIEMAIAMHNEKMAALLYKHSQQLEEVNADKFNALSLAWNEDKKIFDRLCADMIAAGDLKSLMSLESLNLPGFDYHYVTDTGDSFTNVAARYGQLNILQWLHERKGCQLDVKNNFGNDPVLVATFNRNLATLKWLVEVRGCSLAVKNNDGADAVLLAAYSGDVATLQYLVEVRGCNLGVKNNIGNDPVLEAASNGKLATLKWLLEVRGCSVAVKNIDGSDAVLLATYSGDIATLQYLVEVRGCNLDVKNNIGNDPVLEAAYYGHLATLQYLVEKRRCNLDVKNNIGDDAVLLATYNGQLATLQWLVDVKRLTLNVKNNAGYDPVLIAIYFGHLATLQWLVEIKHLKLDVKNNAGYIPVLIAAHSGDLPTMEWLVDGKGCTLDVKNNAGYNPVLMAAHGGNLPTMQWLVDGKGLTLDTKTNAGEYPVMLAASRGHLATLQWLVEKKKCFYDVSRPTPLLDSIKNWKSEIFAYCFSDLFDSFHAIGMLNEFLKIAEYHFTQMTSQADQVKCIHLYEKKLENENPAPAETLNSYYRVNPTAAFKFKVSQLLRESKYEQCIDLCYNNFQSDNATLREEASIVVAEQIHMKAIRLDEEGSPLDHLTGENSDKLKRAIQAFYLLADYNGKAATALKDYFHVTLSGANPVSREQASELTWCDQAAHYYLLYMAYKQNPYSKHIQQLIAREKGLPQNSDNNEIPRFSSSSSLFEPKKPRDTANKAPVVRVPTHKATTYK